jgi:outer membrane protein OmpA-like peptidoglycan-associated protein
LYLVNAGESRDRFDIIGYGEDDPADTNETKEGRARNRRIVFIALEGT